MRLEIFLYFCSDNFSQMSEDQLEKQDLLMKKINNLIRNGSGRRLPVL